MLGLVVDFCLGLSSSPFAFFLSFWGADRADPGQPGLLSFDLGPGLDGWHSGAQCTQ